MSDLNHNMQDSLNNEVWYEGRLYKIFKYIDPDTVELISKMDSENIGKVKSEKCDCKNILD